jgi:hypothetical protein
LAVKLAKWQSATDQSFLWPTSWFNLKEKTIALRKHVTVQPQSPWLPFVEMFSLFSIRRDDPLTRLVLDARMSQWGRPFWVSTLLHHCRQTHVTYAIRRGVD